jgi:Uma2 family endonuclease
MNELSHPPKSRPTTQAAEGAPRLRWTLAEFERLTELGIFTEDDRIELIGGELVPMSPKGNRHEIVRDELMTFFADRLSGTPLKASSEIGWRPNAESYFEPDILIYPRTFKGVTVPPAEVLLAIEIADSSLKFDTTTKAGVYASLGVREYWVVNANTLATRVHRQPSAGSYGSVLDVLPNEQLVPLFLPSLSMKLADLPIE